MIFASPRQCQGSPAYGRLVWILQVTSSCDLPFTVLCASTSQALSVLAWCAQQAPPARLSRESLCALVPRASR